MVDALGMFFLVSDGGLYLDTFHTSLLGEEDRTCLFLMDQEEFPQWIHRLGEDRKISKNETTWEGENPTGQDKQGENRGSFAPDCTQGWS